MAKYDNILQTIGNTPLVRLKKLAPDGVNVFVKVESFNPMGSVKDRMARAVIEEAEARGALRPGQTVIEATSGNTGIGLAMVCAQKGYPLVIVMAENFSLERRKLMRFLGARVVLTPASEKGSGMLAKASELAQRHGYFLCNQFQNEANAQVHSRTTAVEILEEFTDEPLHYWVSGFGTGGTLKGVARRLKVDSPDTRIVVAEPENSQVLGSGVPQPRDDNGDPSASHPCFRPHAMQGWSPDFISSLTEEAVAAGWVDEVEPVNGDASMALCRELAQREGILAGISGGATLAAALAVAERSAPGTNIVCMLPDTGERYLSTPLFADIPEEMSAEELAISESTPLCRFREAAAGVVSLPDRKSLSPSAQQFYESTVAEHPLVMFSLEWCEFCWSTRKLLQALGVDYLSVDLDAVAMQQDGLGDELRKVLAAELGVPTIPQIFIGGEYMGGASELFAMQDRGELLPRLRALSLDYDESASPDLSKLMPQWLQPRQSA